VREFQGIGASEGVVFGPARVWHKQNLVVTRRQCAPEEVAGELQRLDAALAMTRAELLDVRGQLASRLGEDHAAILDAQLLILEDETVLSATRESIRHERCSAEAAFARSMAHALMPLDLQGDTVFRERLIDFRDLEQRVLRALQGGADSALELSEPCVLVAPVLTPSETAALDRHRVLGFCVDEGGPTSHTAILARSLGVPAVVGLRELSNAIQDGCELVVDGTTGLVIADPTAAVIKRSQARSERWRRMGERLQEMRDQPAITPDGHVVELAANAEVPFEIELAMETGAQGIGLLRTEYFYFKQGRIPSEEEQFAAYRDVLSRARGETVIFRVLDVGGDKFITGKGGLREANPQLGMRGIRFLLSNAEVLYTQLRSLYRASAFGPVRIMFPMITGLEELRAANDLTRRCRDDLQREGKRFEPDLDVGIMVETPSAVAMARELAAECAFFSIGTNDLTQYILAVDRTNWRVAHLHRPHHPAVLRAIAETISAGHSRGIPVRLCGEMGANPANAILLMGLGIDGISTHAAAIPALKKVIRTITYAQAKAWAQEALSLSTADDVREFLRSKTQQSLRGVLDRRA
jgi:phosphotransferase system enzyme I (PtsI)